MMTEEAAQTGLRPVGDTPEHADDRPVNRAPALPEENDPETPGLGQHGDAAQHEPEFTRVQGSSGTGEGGPYMPGDS
jgi:hypothetical protein